MFRSWYPKSCVMLVEALTFRAGPGRIAACGHRPCSSSSTRQQLLPPPCPAEPTPPSPTVDAHCTLSIGSYLKPQRAGLQERGSDARAVGLHVQKPQQRRQQRQVLGAHALRPPPRPLRLNISPQRVGSVRSQSSLLKHIRGTQAQRRGNSSQSGWQHTVDASQ
eukprot:COSAG01_NODE_1554_length_9930_cov_19.371478_7_plen_164_part_00